ncbi:MAG: hypothetical protein Q9166_003348 [cf. Caloplaca sp. 2 TL-2023]
MLDPRLLGDVEPGNGPGCDVVLDPNVVLVNDNVHLFPRFKQIFAHRRSVHIVVGNTEELVLITLEGPITVGKLSDVTNEIDDEGSEDTAVPLDVLNMLLDKERLDRPEVVGSGVLVGKIEVGADEGVEESETVQPSNGRQTPMHASSVQVVEEKMDRLKELEEVIKVGRLGDGVTVFGFEIGVPEEIRDVEKVVREGVWLAKLETTFVELAELELGTHVGPIHKLTQSGPEQEGVGVKIVLVVGETKDPLEDETTGGVGLARLEVDEQLDPRQTLKHSGSEQEGVAVIGTLALVILDETKVDPEADPEVIILKHRAPEQDVLEGVDTLDDGDVVETDPDVLLIRLLAELVGRVGLVTVLGIVDEQSDPRHIDTHKGPLQDVVKEDDKLKMTDDSVIDEGGGVIEGLGFMDVLPLVVDGHNGPTHKDTQMAPLHELELVKTVVNKEFPDVTTDGDEIEEVVLDDTVSLLVKLNEDVPSEVDVGEEEMLELEVALPVDTDDTPELLVPKVELTVDKVGITDDMDEDWEAGPVVEIWLLDDVVPEDVPDMLELKLELTIEIIEIPNDVVELPIDVNED